MVTTGRMDCGRWLAGLALLLWGLVMVPVWAAEPLRLNTGVGAPYIQADKQGFLDLLVPEIFRRLGVRAEAVGYAASERANINADSGLDDGVAMRVRGLEANYPSLIRVDEKVIDNDFVAYSIRHPFATTGFETLKPYQTAFISGWVVFAKRIDASYAVTQVQDANQLFSLLANDRADVVLFERWQGNWLIRERRLPARLLLPPLVSTEMFMYLHKKHADLVAPAAKALRAMKADGSYRRIFEQSLQVLEQR